LIWTRGPATDRLANSMDSVEKNAGDDFGTDIPLPCSEGRGRRLLNGAGEAANGCRAWAGGRRKGIRVGGSEAADTLRRCHFCNNLHLSRPYVSISSPTDPIYPPRAVTLSRSPRTMFTHRSRPRHGARRPALDACSKELQQKLCQCENVHTCSRNNPFIATPLLRHEHEDQAKSTYHTPKGFLGLVTENEDLIFIPYVMACISLTHKREP